MNLLPPLTAAELFARVVAALPIPDDLEDLPGEGLMLALAAMVARSNERTQEWSDAHYIQDATGEQHASGTVTITWSAGLTNDTQLAAGQRIAGTKWGVYYELTEAMDVSGPQSAGYTAELDARAVRPGFDGNNPAEYVTEWALPGGVDTASVIVWGRDTGSAAKTAFLAGVADGTIAIEGTTDFTGGAPGTLDLLAAERGMPRGLREDDAGLRAAIRAQPDGVSPLGLQELINQFLSRYGDEWTGIALEHEMSTASQGLVIGDATYGVVGQDGPRRRQFVQVVLFENGVAPSGEVDGFTIGSATKGVIGDASDPIGLGDTYTEGIVNGLQSAIDRHRPVGTHIEVVRQDP